MIYPVADKWGVLMFILEQTIPISLSRRQLLSQTPQCTVQEFILTGQQQCYPVVRSKRANRYESAEGVTRVETVGRRYVPRYMYNYTVQYKQTNDSQCTARATEHYGTNGTTRYYCTLPKLGIGIQIRTKGANTDLESTGNVPQLETTISQDPKGSRR